MMNIILFDDNATRENLLPLSYTRPISDIRFGITTIKEKWERMLPGCYSYLTVDYLQEKYPATITDDNIFVAGNICPTEGIILAIKSLQPCHAVTSNGKLVAMRGNIDQFNARAITHETKLANTPASINMLYDIFMGNHDALVADYKMLVNRRQSQPLNATNLVVGDINDKNGLPMVFLEEGAMVDGAILNVKDGPIYVGRNAEIMEGCCVRGPVALCDHAVANMGSKIYGATTLGPYCKVGGELNNVVMIGYSNKAHDGFLGNAVIGEWCNLGAGCVASNLKNDYAEIKLWNYPAHRFLPTGLQFCGLIMGDHSKAGINSMFNTATVIGVGVNIHGAGFPRNFVASFSEGSTAGFTDVPLTRFFDIARRVMARRDKELTDADIKIFESIYNIAENYK